MIPWDKLALSHSVGMADHTRHTSLPKVRGHNQMLKWYVLPKSPTVHQPFEYCGSSLWDIRILIPRMIITCCHHPSHIAETMRPSFCMVVTKSSWPLSIHHWLVYVCSVQAKKPDNGWGPPSALRSLSRTWKHDPIKICNLPIKIDFCWLRGSC